MTHTDLREMHPFHNICLTPSCRLCTSRSRTLRSLGINRPSFVYEDVAFCSARTCDSDEGEGEKYSAT